MFPVFAFISEQVRLINPMVEWFWKVKKWERESAASPMDKEEIGFFQERNPLYPLRFEVFGIARRPGYFPGRPTLKVLAALGWAQRLNRHLIGAPFSPLIITLLFPGVPARYFHGWRAATLQRPC